MSDVKSLLERVSRGELSVDDALLSLKKQPFEDLGYANIDLHRGLRQGENEVVYGKGKTAAQISGIVTKMLECGFNNIIITRLDEAKFNELDSESLKLTYYSDARIAIAAKTEKQLVGYAAVVSAGTSDLAVAEEAAVTLEALGNKVVRIYDAGVSGLHRLLSRLDDIMRAEVVVAIAGMEGALASVVGGLVDCPVIAVPTSVGYGASFNGVAALLSMLNSCASGVSVVNIDNGFGAGYLASMINKKGK